ncbi:MAG TPA: Asp-tRNA(Asn)/Glu-tRNA(Gln) amidotransferase subunit GatA [Geminicoccus sp.]|jgi:aspartyl-tRNA(Asn)/glutamyl-tRNA(Gln) amidotransferase subunit A|nr:Asp-tRNA(Asn)/Glu-tRNA(Gln) amidotransferase subunit GatA [Geminicoccus sp.]HEX2527589.1 Asp-tRNA(Asn)/Glu-tRNA(Gln) amidotransferase subunit GatA [Geminicoccus sp.]
MSVDLNRLTLAEASRSLAAKEYSAVELAEAFIAQMECHRALNAFITETPEQALAMARASDERIARGEAGALEGIPIAVKDLFCTNGIRTTAGSAILQQFVPPYESTVTSKLWQAGAVCLGKTSLDQFGMGSANLNSAFGPVISPWTKPGDEKPLVPGGSSGGSAAAVAARMCLAATGTDTGGSIRQPAAFTGIAGIKPTYGRCSRFGIIAYASSLDQAGAFARNVRDCAVMLQAMAGYDPNDSTSADLPVPDFQAGIGKSLKGLRIGIPKEYRAEGLSPEIDRLWQQGADWLRAQGAEVKEVSLPHSKYALATYYIIAPAEVSSNLARYDGMRYGLRVEGRNLTETYERSRGAGFGDEAKRRIMIGTYVLSAGYYDAYYVKAQKLRRILVDDFTKVFEQVDAVLAPTTPTPAFRIAEEPDDPVAMYLNDVFTVTANLTGLPGMSVPSGLSSGGLPLGLQVMGKPWDEATVLQIGAALEEAADFKTLPYGIEARA